MTQARYKFKPELRQYSGREILPTNLRLGTAQYRLIAELYYVMSLLCELSTAATSAIEPVSGDIRK
jgi:hypothetical protein